MTEKEMIDEELVPENVITLLDDNDEAMDFEVIDVLELEGKRYAFLAPMDSAGKDLEEDEAVIFRVDTDEDGEDVFAYIEDDKEWDMVVNTYNEMLFEDME